MFITILLSFAIWLALKQLQVIELVWCYYLPAPFGFLIVIPCSIGWAWPYWFSFLNSFGGCQIMNFSFDALEVSFWHRTVKMVWSWQPQSIHYPPRLSSLKGMLEGFISDFRMEAMCKYCSVHNFISIISSVICDCPLVAFMQVVPLIRHCNLLLT